MLALLLGAGLLAEGAAPDGAVVQRGDDAPRRVIHGRVGPSKRWQDDLFEANVASVERWAKALPSKRKRKLEQVSVASVIDGLEDTLEADLSPIVVADILAGVNALMARQVPDYSAIANAVMMAIEDARQAKRKRRNRRLMLLMM